MDLKLTATAIKEWFQYRCERKTVYQTMSSGSRSSVPIAEVDLTSAWANLGNNFEDEVVNHLKVQFPASVLVPGPNHKSLSEQQAKRFLEGNTPEVFACQLGLSGSDDIHKRLCLPDGISISKTRPDIIRRTTLDDGSFLFHIIDVKATQQAAAFHKVQVAFYAVLLQATFEQMGLSQTHHIDVEGSVWCLPGSKSGEFKTEERFVLKPYAELVIDFMRREMASMARKEVSPHEDNTFFHVYFKCEQCKFLPHCSESLAPERQSEFADLSSIPGMSHQAKRSLHDLGIFTVGDLLADRHKVLDKATSWVLRSRGPTLIARAASLTGGEVSRMPERFSWQMPPRTDVGIYLLADSDPINGDIFSLACSIARAGTEPEHTIRIALDPSDELQCIKDVLDVVTAELARVDAANRSGDDAIVHIFVYEPSEAKDLSEALGRHLNDEGVGRGLLDLVRMFPPDEILPEPNYKGIHHLPACSLRGVVQSLYALPAAVSLDLRSATLAIAESGGSLEPYQPHSPEFVRPFSSRLSLNLIQRARHNPTTEAKLLVSIERDITDRLAAMHRLRVWVEEDNAADQTTSGGFLRLNKGPFLFQSSFDPLGATQLDVLLAQELLENRVGQMSALVELSRPVAERVSRFACYADLQFTGSVSEYYNYGKKKGMRFDVPRESMSAELDNGTLGLVLTDNDPDILLNPQAWRHHAINLATNHDFERPNQIKAEMRLDDFNSPSFRKMWKKNRNGKWFIDKTFADFNTVRIEAFLKFLAVGGEN